MGVRAGKPVKGFSVLLGKVMHARLFPKKNRFTYGIYYIALNLSDLDNAPIPRNRFAPLSFYDKDHGACDGSDLNKWARDLLESYGVTKADGDITLVCMPRVLGYVFNPVSFWLCRDQQGDIRAVICEVHNTFGERHSYLCVAEDQSVIDNETFIKTEKLFHVSPFLERAGQYGFRFHVTRDHFAAMIDYYDASGKKQLVTSLIGNLVPMNKENLRHAFWKYPLVTFKAITLIHWQAVKIISKGIKYIPKPLQNKDKNSASANLKKV
ncbi:MAG: DUF1365 domain-containing protein [Pseudomonadota bacterium]|nr:DUF1365 domain-containing protein [Pseudomonadota bacterium]